MRVLQVTPVFFPGLGGIETVVLELVKHLRRDGVSTDVLHLAPDHGAMRQDMIDDFTVFRAPLRPNRLVGLAPAIGPILKDYDVVHVHDPQLMAVSANVILFGRGKKKALSTHGGYIHTANHALFKKLHWALLARPLLNCYDAILASSEQDFALFKSKAPHARLIQNGVNVEKFISVVRKSAPSATRWIYWGRLSRNKRFDNLIDYVRACRQSGLDIDLLIAGRDFDGLLPSIHAQIAEYGLADNIRVVGSLSDAELMAELEQRSVFITASEYEGFGLSVIEAMAAGLLVLCRDMAPLNGFVENGKNGAFVSLDGAAADLNAITALCAAPEGRIAAMQDNTRATSQLYSWDSAVKKYASVYEDLLADRL
jgi:alpha-1,3-mannosyltransferase